MKYKVEGGVYTDLTFEKIEPGTEESYGPFDTREEAYTKWLEIARFKVDNACHRVVITPPLRKHRTKYTLEELIDKCDQSEEMHEDREFADLSVGRETI